MHWLLILTITYNGHTRDMPWALVPDADICTVTGAGSVAMMQALTPGLRATWSCAPEVAA